MAEHCLLFLGIHFIDVDEMYYDMSIAKTVKSPFSRSDDNGYSIYYLYYTFSFNIL